ncbi:MAG: hypothetical protein LBM62_03615 [Mediterranea sp.]|jgi:hypothetical protein|nr:hypothetical protein [Mediterranea sp.]
MKLKTMLFASLGTVCLGVSSVYAQEETTQKEVVLMDNFTLVSTANAVYHAVAIGVREKVIGEIQKMNRIDLIDVTTDPLFKSVLQKTQGEDALDQMLAMDFTDPQIQEVIAEKQAKWAIQGHISNMSAVKKKYDNGSTYYDGELALSLKLVDLTNNTVKATKNYSYGGLTGKTGDTDKSAVIATADYLTLQIPKFIDENFKAGGTIYEITKNKKGEADVAYITLGNNMGLKKGQPLEVFVESERGGRVVKNKVGELSITEVEGDDSSACKVKKGGKEIAEAFDAKKTISIVTRAKKANPFDAIGAALK